MAFQPYQSRVPDKIRAVQVTLVDRLEWNDPDQPAGKAARYELTVFDQNKQPLHSDAFQGNLVPHITQEEMDWLIVFMDNVRARAEAAIIPAP